MCCITTRLFDELAWDLVTSERTRCLQFRGFPLETPELLQHGCHSSSFQLPDKPFVSVFDILNHYFYYNFLLKSKRK